MRSTTAGRTFLFQHVRRQERETGSGTHLPSMLSSLQVKHPRLDLLSPPLPPPHHRPPRPNPLALVFIGGIDKLVQPQSFHVLALGALPHYEPSDEAGKGLFELGVESGHVAQRVVGIVIRRLKGRQVEFVDGRARKRRLRRRRSVPVPVSMMRRSEEGLEHVRVHQWRDRVEGSRDEGEEVGLVGGGEEDVDMRSRGVPDV